jgi:hypothetical protein
VKDWRYSFTIIDLGTRSRWVVNFRLLSLYRRGKSPRCPLDRSVDGTQKTLDAVKKRKILNCLESNPGRPAAHYRDQAIPACCAWCTGLKVKYFFPRKSPVIQSKWHRPMVLLFRWFISWQCECQQLRCTPYHAIKTDECWKECRSKWPWPFRSTIPIFTWRAWRKVWKPSVSTYSVPTESRTQEILNTIHSLLLRQRSLCAD